jgi:two-component system, cell cycle sensor histidine kinase DivJ
VGNVGAFAPIRDYVETLVHPSAQQDALTAARHFAFIAPRLIGGVVALASLPFYLIVRGAPSSAEFVVFGWPAVPIFSACLLSRTGDCESAHVVSALALAGFAFVAAVSTGGAGSCAAVWLVVAPLEAMLSASRRVIAMASTAALGAVAVLVLLGAFHLLVPSGGEGSNALAAVCIASAVLYAAALALAAADLARSGSALLRAQEDRYRLLAHTMTDVITRHGPDGDVLFVSPAAADLFGVPIPALHGRGLLQRVHVADRPAYLMALGDAAALSEIRSAEFRVRRSSDDERGDAAPFVRIEMQCRPFDQTSGTSNVKRDRQVVAVLRQATPRDQKAPSFEQTQAEFDSAKMPLRKRA